MMDAKPGDRCSNGPYVRMWTCPDCYNDHDHEVTECTRCGIALICTIESPPIAVCEIAEGATK
ncbi:hypothetical protein QCD71_12240 [Sphingomonas sp. PsM26]|nr:hypothetical protein [Sphingomonas sp. PsM26]